MSCLKCSDFLDISEEERVRDYSLLPSLSIDSPTNNIHHLTDIDATTTTTILYLLEPLKDIFTWQLTKLQ